MNKGHNLPQTHLKNYKIFKALTKFVELHIIHSQIARQIKASIMARSISTNWSDELSIVLMGLRSIIKRDLNYTAREMVYGRNIRLSRKMVAKSQSSISTEEFISKLRNYCQNFQSNISHKSKDNIYAPKSLNECNYVLHCFFFGKFFSQTFPRYSPLWLI